MSSKISLQSTMQGTRLASARMSRPVQRQQRLQTRAALETSIVISSATAASLALGRFVFLPFQRDNVKRQGLGELSNSDLLSTAQHAYYPLVHLPCIVAHAQGRLLCFLLGSRDTPPWGRMSLKVYIYLTWKLPVWEQNCSITTVN